MPLDDDKTTITIPFGNTEVQNRFSRYQWFNDRRGPSQFVIIQTTLSGKGTFFWSGDTHEVPAGHAFLCLVPERSSYSLPETAREPWAFAWINLYGELAMSYCRAFRATYGPVLELPFRSLPFTLFSNLVSRTKNREILDPIDATQQIFTFFMEWKRLLDRPRLRDTDPVDLALRICQARFREPLGIKELACQANLSREHLTRIFTQRTGRSPARHLRDLRLHAALKMLNSHDTTLQETALRCGFSSKKALQRAISLNADGKTTPDLPTTSRSPNQRFPRTR